MYPFIRLAKAVLQDRTTPVDIFDTLVTRHIAWPWDIDPWKDLNNGRTLTLFDLGRIALMSRAGLFRALRAHRWGIVVAGNTTRYRRRITMWQRFEMRTRCIGWDQRFLYMEQGMYRGGECCNHVLIRAAVTSPKGIVPPAEVCAAMGLPVESPDLPQWVRDWITSENERVWPPTL